MTPQAGNRRSRKPITIEAEYTLPEDDLRTKNQWTFDGISARKAKDKVLRDRIPLDATVSRIGAWSGSPADRPDGGHETGIFSQ